MVKYLLIQSSEDGEPITLLTEEELQDLLKDPTDNYGVHRFLEDYPPKSHNYWDSGDALLLEIKKIVVPKPVTVEYRL